MASDISYNKLSIPESLDELSEKIIKMNQMVNGIDKLNKRIGTRTDNEGLWIELSETHITFQHKVSRCQRLYKMQCIINNLSTADSITQYVDISNISFVRGLSKYESLQTGRLKNELNDVVLRYTKLQKQISLRERGVIKRSRHNSTRSSSDDNATQVQTEECWLDGQEILEREQHIKKIEDDMLTVADMMKEISYMVHDQGTGIDNIEAHIVESHRQVDEGTSLLSKAGSSRQKKRKRVLCLSVVFVIILVVMIVTIVVIQKTR